MRPTVNTMCEKVLAVQKLALSAIMAVPAKLGVVCCNLVAKLEPLYMLSNLDNDSARLVASNHWAQSLCES